MRRHLLYSLLLFPLFSFSQLDSLKGSVKSVKERVKYAEDIGFTFYHRELDFGQYGLTEESIFKEFKKGLFPARPLSPTQKEFDKKGRLIKLSFLSTNDSLFSSSWKYVYDEYNNLVQEKSELSGGSYEVTNYRYRPFNDSLDHLMTEISYSSDPDWFKMKQYFYDNQVKLIETRELSGFGWDRKTNYNYDKAGRLIAEINSDTKRVLKFDSAMRTQVFIDSATDYYSETYSYYDDGSLKEKISGCSPDFIAGACQRTVYSYDDKKRKSKIHYYWMGRDSIFSRRVYTYNPDNTIKKIEWFFRNETPAKNLVEYFYRDRELVKAVFTDSDKMSKIEFKHKFDSHNNWIEQVKTVNDKIFYTRKREITYWD